MSERWLRICRNASHLVGTLTRFSWHVPQNGHKMFPELFESVSSAFDWRALRGHRFFPMPWLFVFNGYSVLAIEVRYSSMWRAAALTEFGACFYLRILLTAICGATRLPGKTTSLRYEEPSLYFFLHLSS